MGSRDRENKSFQDKFKQFFKRQPGIRSRSSFELTEDIQKDIGKETSPQLRIKRLKELNERISNSNLDTDTISKLWTCLEDIFPTDNLELRHAAFTFLTNLVKRQNEELKVTRAHFFRFIISHKNPQDVAQRLHFLISLTNNGKNVQHFEEEIGPFLLGWFDILQKNNQAAISLDLILNIVKFNAVCLESFILAGLIDLICILCCGTYEGRVIRCSLHILETVIAYSNMPARALPRLIGALCRTVNNEEYCQLSWKVVKNLLGTHMGHSALFTLCLILQEPNLKTRTHLLRGAVFFVHMSLWGTKPVASLSVPPSSVLPSFLDVVKTDHPIICYEVVLGMQALVQKKGIDLQPVSWKIILEIIQHVNNSVENNLDQPSSNLLLKPLHDTLSLIENLIDSGSFGGSLEQFFNIIEDCANSRPEGSILRLIEQYSRDIVSTEHAWLTNLNNLLNKYLKPDEIRTNIRLAALSLLSSVALLNRKNYEEEFVERIVIPHCTNITNDSNIFIRTSVANCLLTLCRNCETKKCVEMLEIIEKLLFRPFELQVEYPLTEDELSDVLNIVERLIEIFLYKIELLPSSHAIKIYNILVRFLETHYKKPKVFSNCYQIRYKIFECFLKMRANDKYFLGYLKDESTLIYSLYLCVTTMSRDRNNVGSPLPQSPAIGQHIAHCNITYVSIKRAFAVFITCLKQERDWNVMRLVLQELPKVLRNKTLIVSKHGNIELDILVDVLSPTILDKNFVMPEHFAKSVTKLEYINNHLMILAAMPSYHTCLGQKHQQILVRCLSRCICNSLRTNPKQLIEALTICCLEMRDVMVKMLPDILLSVSRISPTVLIAIPVLEFLSTLTQLPMVYASFVEEEYMAVFAITSPFTNPFKYNHYTVSLAHYVIGAWFLKCRLPIRKNFVKFMTSALQTNVLTPFEETNFLNRLDLSKLNTDSSDRKRSSSLTEQGPRRRAATVSGGSGSGANAGISISQDNKSGPKIPLAIPLLTAANTSVLTFYEELTETCIDLMARYSFSPSSALPRRTPTAEFLLSGGQSMSWLLGNKLITITTSGCSQKVLKQGLCDKCLSACSIDNQLPQSRNNSVENPDNVKVTRQNSNEKSTTGASSPVEEGKKIGDEKEDAGSKLNSMVDPDTDKYEKPLCACWCQSWAEIFVRRPTGDMSWIMRIQNTISSKSLLNEFPLKELSNLFLPSFGNAAGPSTSNTPPVFRSNLSEEVAADDNQEKEKDEQSSSVPISIPSSPARNSPSRQSSRDSVDEDMDYIYDDGTKSRNPVRRSNSSPEMSNWKNPFLHMKHDDDKNLEEDGGKKGKLHSKDMRVSCEAIPEEIAGTTPPSMHDVVSPKTDPQKSAVVQNHPSLLSCHSYPGSSPPKDNSKRNQTVPPSPNVNNITQPFPQKSTLSKNSSSDLSLESAKSDEEIDRSVHPLVHSKIQSISSKPPQSPTPNSPKDLVDKEGNEIQKSASASVLDKNSSVMSHDKNKERKSTGNLDKLLDLDPQKRDRTHTVAGISSTVRKPRSEQLKQLNMRPREAPKSGINPSFIFLQLYQRVDYGDSKEKPLLIGTDEPIRRAVAVLDHIPPYETHKIGVIYIRDGQVNKESEILKNKFGSIRYGEFLRRLGTLFRLQDVDPQLFFLGGLSQNGEDGRFSYIWQDDLVKMIFHVATLMPTKESDLHCTEKKSHIGNNNVTIVYNESGEEYQINTIKSQFNFACVIIHPMDQNLNRVTFKCKKELINLMGTGCQESKIVSDQSVAILARQLALHANLASLVYGSLHCNAQSPYASNWLERLRQIKKIRGRLLEGKNGDKETVKGNMKPRQKQMEDFTEYT